MVSAVNLLFGGVFGLIALWAGHRLSVVGRAALALRRATPADPRTAAAGDRIALDGRVFVDDPAPHADRLFDETDGRVGAYVWQAWFGDAGTYTYDRQAGEFRQARNTFASGVTAGRFGVRAAGRDVLVDVDWLERTYDGTDLASLEVGNPASDASLPAVATRHAWNGVYLHLTEPERDRSVSRLTDVVDLYREDVAADEFDVTARGVAAGGELFVSGELRVDGEETAIVGTENTPLLLSDQGPEGLARALRWRAAKYALGLVAAAGVGSLFAL